MIPTDGIYRISKRDGNDLTILSDSTDAPLALLPPGEPSEQEWELKTHPEDRTVSFRNAKSGLFAGVQTPSSHGHAILSQNGQSWVLEEAEGGEGVYIRLPEKDSADELVLELSMLRIFPPRVALQNKRHGDWQQTWRFEKLR
jgi:hypothetical protein